MKKNVLALSIATAVVGFAGSAHAITTPGGATATDLQFGNTGTGHMLLVPYFSTQSGNSTLLSLINTDTVNGKAVKVRFRGALNSDDIFDFQVFLSPGDVWTANVSQGADGRSALTTSDNTCTKPAKKDLNASFVTSRLKSTWDTATKANNTREGYIEIFNMADIPGPNQPGYVANGLYPLIKHANSVADCANKGTNTAWTALDTNLAGVADYAALGLTAPKTGLAANWTIINVPKALSFSGAATAIEAVNAAGTPALGNVVYFPQTSRPLPTPASYTADPLLAQNVVQAAMYDVPDMSTPYTNTANKTPAQQATDLASAIATNAVINEFWSVDTIQAATDWVFSMPTRRYAVAMDYEGKFAANAGKTGPVFNGGVNTHFTATNITQSGDALCVRDITANLWDREENTPANPSEVVISPGEPTAPTLFCGETSVLSFNNGGAATTAVVAANVAVKDLDVAYDNGWAALQTPGLGNGLPILGTAFASAFNAAASKGVAGNYGVTWTHRFVRPVAAQ